MILTKGKTATLGGTFFHRRRNSWGKGKEVFYAKKNSNPTNWEDGGRKERQRSSIEGPMARKLQLGRLGGGGKKELSKVWKNLSKELVGVRKKKKRPTPTTQGENILSKSALMGGQKKPCIKKFKRSWEDGPPPECAKGEIRNSSSSWEKRAHGPDKKGHPIFFSWESGGKKKKGKKETHTMRGKGENLCLTQKGISSGKKKLTKKNWGKPAGGASLWRETSRKKKRGGNRIFLKKGRLLPRNARKTTALGKNKRNPTRRSLVNPSVARKENKQGSEKGGRGT